MFPEFQGKAIGFYLCVKCTEKESMDLDGWGEREIGAGWLGRIQEEMREGKPWPKYIVWKKILIKNK